MDEQTKPKPWEHNGTDEIVCPHCGYVHGDSWEHSDKYDDGKIECEGCGNPFEWSRDITVTYSTKSAAGVESEVCPDCRGLCGKANADVTIFTPCQLCGGTGSVVSAEQRWTNHASLLAQKMKLGGVKSFRIELTPRGTYEFEVVPTATPNDQAQLRRVPPER